MVRSVVRHVVGVVVVACTAAGWMGGAAPAGAQSGERIVSFASELRIEGDGDLRIRETITYDFAGNQRHGIIRLVPVELRYDDRFDRVYPLRVGGVQASEGTPAGFTVESNGRFEGIRIGDPERTITGVHTYTIDYRIEAALNGFDDHDELYWNAVGSGWDVPVDRAEVRVEAPAPIEDVACFAGPVGSSLPCTQSSFQDSAATFAGSGLGPGQDLTVVVAIPKGAVPEPVPRLEERWSVTRAFELSRTTVGGASVLLVLAVAAFARLAWKAGRDRRFVGSPVDVVFGTASGEDRHVPLLERPVTPVEFVPPDNLRPGQVGTLVDERANPLDVIATIVDLAVRGYLRIEEIPKQGWFGKPDWNMVRLKEPDGLRPYEALLLTSLFQGAGDGEVRLSSLKNTFATRLGKVEDALYADAVDQKWFPTRPDHVRALWAVVGAVVAVVGVGLVALAARFTHLGLVPVPVIVAGLLLLVGSRWMPRRTARGTAALRRVLGFRRFIDESEAERARFAERTNLFSEYLPYAIVFGCTEKWARAFAGLDGELPDVPWYRGHGAFTASSFSDSMDGFTVTTAGTMTSTPSGSGSSGFGGGGSSGGGGGGGGGGSW